MTTRSEFRSTGKMRASARELQRKAAAVPLAEAGPEGGTLERTYFEQIDRELTWGLTLNK